MCVCVRVCVCLPVPFRGINAIPAGAGHGSWQRSEAVRAVWSMGKSSP